MRRLLTWLFGRRDKPTITKPLPPPQVFAEPPAEPTILIIEETALEPVERSVPKLQQSAPLASQPARKPKPRPSSAGAPASIVVDEETGNYILRGIETTVFLRYRDANGSETERNVTIKTAEFYMQNQEFGIVGFSGFCHLRKRARSFRADRVIEIADHDTGEVWDDIIVTMLERGGQDSLVAMLAAARTREG
ncbi:hypothetical protein [Roseomonas chloroacetimidivorans]|uniref:hypothetical protein n=1 Tax=Roseomonas chloroacetimidivorans TaxID=1766656 RepID=UPI003C76148A